MAAYRNAELLNSPNTNNNNNNNHHHHHHLAATLSRDPHDYSSTQYNQQQNYKSTTMPKSHYQNTTTTTKDFLPADNGNNYLTASSSFDTDSNSNLNESSKRLNNPNGKFSIQKMIRQGFSSWRTRKKPPSLSASPSPPITSTNAIYANAPTPPPLSAGRYMTNNDDFSQIPPPTAVRSISVDSIANRTPPQRIIVTESVTLSSARANSVDSVTVDFDRPPASTRAYIQSPWTSSATSTVMTATTTTPPITTEFMPGPAPMPITRVLPVQFTENNKISTPRSPPPPPPPSFVSPPPPPNISSSSTTKPTETNHNTTPLTNIVSNPNRIPPPGMFYFISSNKTYFFSFFQLPLNLMPIDLHQYVQIISIIITFLLPLPIQHHHQSQV